MCLSVDGRSLVIVGVTQKRRRENELKTIDLIGSSKKTDRETDRQADRKKARQTSTSRSRGSNLNGFRKKNI